jgi:hypothetical protein
MPVMTKEQREDRAMERVSVKIAEAAYAAYHRLTLPQAETVMAAPGAEAPGSAMLGVASRWEEHRLAAQTVLREETARERLAFTYLGSVHEVVREMIKDAF